MATAIGFALAKGGWVSVAIFTGVGAGFAAPFVALTFAITLMPALARRLPKPGIWMVRLRKLLALPMYATALWMMWVFAQQVTGWGVMFFLLALGVFALGMTGSRLPGFVKRGLLGLSGILILAAAWQQTGPQDVEKNMVLSEQEVFSPQRIALLRAEGRPILVDLTAAWCVTCKVNERFVLSAPGVVRALQDSGTIFMVGDWTRQDAVISDYLRQFGRSGVPLYVYYGPRNASPVILPQILRQDKLVNLLLKP
jgi:thiol:disulfide interchange protein DsbD